MAVEPGSTAFFRACGRVRSLRPGLEVPVLLSISSVKRVAFHTIRSGVSRKNAVFPLSAGRAALRRLALYLFKAKTLADSCLVHIDKPFPDGYQSIMGMYYA